MSGSLTFEAVSEDRPGAKWLKRWTWSWPAYKAWFTARGGDRGPSRTDCEAAIRRHMPELAEVHAELSRLAGGGDRAARFLSGWCPPAYLGGCSLAAHARDGEVRLVRNYDLSPDLNEGLLLRSAWRRPVMGMVEFLWGLSDGINDAGFCVALAYGGRGTTGRGFGITHIVRYLLETCDTVDAALRVLARLPSHMAYNLVLADASGQVASVELLPGGGMRRMNEAIATNHQHGSEPADRPAFTRTLERRTHMSRLLRDGTAPGDLGDQFLGAPLYQRRHGEGFGTLFTADYDARRGRLKLLWHGEVWEQSLSGFMEGTRTIHYDQGRGSVAVGHGDEAEWSAGAQDGADWIAFGMSFAQRYMLAHMCQAKNVVWEC
ncbi:C45 family autoproteolytic acyltransferase/hydolase [Litorisediminicola beolgyonensis]|uniref:C45 family autoproteolytic acyltransferase/hydrolase n=1 Tax=Litorisediminicola beolgyonensis TaxID=1173614 RepID=A0ABW3ZM13_9RHOB